MEMEAGRCTGTLIHCDGYSPSNSRSLGYFSVPSIVAALEKIEFADGKTLMPESNIRDHGKIANFGDTEGNWVGLHQALATAVNC